MKNEIRIFEGAELRALADGKRIEGHAAIWRSWSHDLGGFREQIMPGAFTKCLRNNKDILCLAQHDVSKPLGRTGRGTLKLAEDSKGLAFEVKLGNASYARDMADNLARGDVSQCSFGFTTPAGGDSWDHKPTPAERTLHEINLLEISLVTMPAYEATSAALRSRFGEIGKIGTYPVSAPAVVQAVPDLELERLTYQLRLRQLGY